MDILNIPDPTNYSNTVLVRVVSVDDDEEENVTVVAEEYPVGDQSPTTMPMSPTTPPNQGPTNNPPLPVYPPVIFEPTTAMLTATGFATPQVVVGASAGVDGVLDLNYGGAFVWVSTDAANYQFMGTIEGPSTVGSLSQNLPGYGGSNPDNTDTLYVNLNESDGTLMSVDSIAAAGGSTICVIQDVSGFEVVGYTTATLVGPYTYALTGLYRGLYGTTSRFFGLGSRFLFVGTGSIIFETNMPVAYVGHTLWVKLQAFNVFNQAEQDLADVVAYEYIVGGSTPVGPKPPPSIEPRSRRTRNVIAPVGRVIGRKRQIG